MYLLHTFSELDLAKRLQYTYVYINTYYKLKMTKKITSNKFRCTTNNIQVIGHHPTIVADQNKKAACANCQQQGNITIPNRIELVRTANQLHKVRCCALD